MKFKFYVQMDGEVFGPYSTSEIMNLGLLDDILVTEESMDGEWIPAGQFNFADLLRRENESEGTVRTPYVSRAPYPDTSDTSSSRKPLLKWVAIIVLVLAVGGGLISIIGGLFSSPSPSPSPSPIYTPSPSPKPQPNGGGRSQQTSDDDIVVCIHCVGSGYSYGGVCKFCKGTGHMTRREFEQLINGGGGGGGSSQDWSDCPHCHGSGKCPTCAGRGEKRSHVDNSLYDCYECHGSGRCTMCLGKGVYIH